MNDLEELKKVLEALIERKEKDSLLSNNQEVNNDFKVLKEIIRELIREKRIDMPTVIALIKYFWKKYGTMYGLPVTILGVTVGFIIYIIIRFP